MTNVITLKDASSEAKKPNQLTIDRCKELLEAAESGDLQGFVAVGETANGELVQSGSDLFDLPLINIGLDMAKARIIGVTLHGAEQ